ncbi:TPA: hypothetical protein DIU27_02395 [Candidatus Collierbacteria bacterium]|uniref:Uncharacterized protein n=1 Tax=Candidatus Collierbacteria bacterium GW2011_GWB2_44_22 TaxID=1618387 RepID=A0A0G1K6K3_9BACT|nr:MAG: hypothetical protein UW44_C0005G0004 [Candidatus Collierbacteria bacterium GW2011_GWB2_44_22]KKT62259.1 MAG: hypothetical protein UW56_C0009G0033 [Candidatus Collierbacteria bacterium GW2011_GWD1_44_27]KKT69442.1 MAG: hypothetical protein UW64_C0001G0088 [Microgenomates group bacterium GW2011_GWC1_44_37]KKT89750.1 MAG: hypothetical protein UW88_C0001G0130 [Candidatus Collierbacteria bacterium GW2011_GWD2_45_10]HCQ31209.1 hypothetical protein [Candidatus Collierbacteria bacterium]
MPDVAEEKIERKGEPSTIGLFYETIRRANASDKEWQGNKDLQIRQEAILTKLQERFPTEDSLIAYLTEICVEDYKKQQEYARKHHFRPKEYNVRGKVAGELFERFVSAENDVYDLYAETKHTEPLPADPIQKLKEEKFIDVFTNPEKYGFQHMEYFNIPDIPFIVTNEGDHMVLRAVAEVKSSDHLDERLYRQLLPTGIRQALVFTLERLNSLTQKEAIRRGLSGFGQGKEMYMLRDFEQIVVMTRDVNTHDKEKLIATRGMEIEEFHDFRRILEGRHPDSPTIIINSSFNRHELSALFNLVFNQVDEKFKASAPQNLKY